MAKPEGPTTEELLQDILDVSLTYQDTLNDILFFNIATAFATGMLWGFGTWAVVHSARSGRTFCFVVLFGFLSADRLDAEISVRYSGGNSLDYSQYGVIVIDGAGESALFVFYPQPLVYAYYELPSFALISNSFASVPGLPFYEQYMFDRIVVPPGDPGKWEAFLAYQYPGGVSSNPEYIEAKDFYDWDTGAIFLPVSLAATPTFLNNGLCVTIDFGDLVLTQGVETLSLDSVIYQIDFGDGFGSSSFPIVHCYGESGTKTISLSVVYSGILSNVLTFNHAVSEPPIITFIWSSIGSTVTIDHEVTDDTGVASYYWDFGDGQTFEGADSSFTHIYSSPGTYNLSLTVTDIDGTEVTATTTIVIEDSSPSSVGGGSVVGTWSPPATSGDTYAYSVNVDLNPEPFVDAIDGLDGSINLTRTAIVNELNTFDSGDTGLLLELPDDNDLTEPPPLVDDINQSFGTANHSISFVIPFPGIGPKTFVVNTMDPSTDSIRLKTYVFCEFIFSMAYLFGVYNLILRV